MTADSEGCRVRSVPTSQTLHSSFTASPRGLEFPADLSTHGVKVTLLCGLRSAAVVLWSHQPETCLNPRRDITGPGEILPARAPRAITKCYTETVPLPRAAVNSRLLHSVLMRSPEGFQTMVRGKHSVQLCRHKRGSNLCPNPCARFDFTNAPTVPIGNSLNCSRPQ